MATNVATSSRGDTSALSADSRIMGDMIRQVLVVVAFVSTVVVNALANILPINGMDTGELSDKYEIFITPAGMSFQYGV